MSDEIIYKIKRGITAGAVPSSLTFGELAVNTTDGVLFVGGPSGNIVPLVSASLTSVSGGDF
jgi:hypothetical protein